MTFYSEEHVASIRRQSQQLVELHRKHQEERTGEVTDKTDIIDIPVETAGKDDKHKNPIYTAIPESLLEELPRHAGKLIPQETGWVHVKSFLVNRISGELFLSKKAIVLPQMPKGQYTQWCYVRRMETGNGYIVSMLPRDFPYTITYDTPSSDTHLKMTHLIFRVRSTTATPVA